jgi:hypothetical protein
MVRILGRSAALVVAAASMLTMVSLASADEGVGAASSAARSVSGVSPSTTSSASSSPSCTFNGSSLPIIGGASAGTKVKVACSGFAALHPYLVFETSLLLGIDPNAAPLLTGQITSVPGLLALLNALPEINPAALSFQTSDVSGDLDFTYTLPKSMALDPNAVCGPTVEQINSGLLGCALATIDLTSFKPVGTASAVVEYSGDPLFPPAPTLALGSSKATPGSTVALGDAPGATTYWWLATLGSLEALLGEGSAPTPTITVTLKMGKSVVTAANNAAVAPAVYKNGVLTPPKLSGGFTVPAALAKGNYTVTVSDKETILGFPLSNIASALLRVRR